MGTRLCEIEGHFCLLFVFWLGNIGNLRLLPKGTERELSGREGGERRVTKAPT